MIENAKILWFKRIPSRSGRRFRAYIQAELDWHALKEMKRKIHEESLNPDEFDYDMLDHGDGWFIMEARRELGATDG